MDPKLFVWLGLFSGTCNPTPVDPLTEPLGTCQGDPGTAWVEEAEVRGDALDGIVSWDGCLEDEVTPCWDGGFHDGAVDLVLEHVSTGECDRRISRTMLLDLTDVRDAATDRGLRDVELRIDGLAIPYAW